jgi:hypothetical protein
MVAVSDIKFKKRKAGPERAGNLEKMVKGSGSTF